MCFSGKCSNEDHMGNCRNSKNCPQEAEDQLEEILEEAGEKLAKVPWLDLGLKGQIMDHLEVYLKGEEPEDWRERLDELLEDFKPEGVEDGSP